MIPTAESLLKYDNPMLIRSSDRKSPKGRPFKVNPQPPPDFAPIPPPPKPKTTTTDAIRLEDEDILHTILPPREWTDGIQVWVQRVSNAPCSRIDVMKLEEQLDTKLEKRQARMTGICPVRRELYSQCFDELIRQVTINCGERGQLLLRVRDEIRVTMAAYQTLYESSVAFGMRKALQLKQAGSDMEKKIADLEDEKLELRKQLNELKSQCDSIEKRENEKRQIEEMRHAEEIQFYKKSNQQLKTQLEAVILPTK